MTHIAKYKRFTLRRKTLVDAVKVFLFGEDKKIIANIFESANSKTDAGQYSSATLVPLAALECGKDAQQNDEFARAPVVTGNASLE
ncbi:hypothetical protein LJR231_004508 [Phyllobacterium sp. LjRoot231]|uniref:hypothetical protein n=1 Tax=Phyllobacterium sp. LjRoot231 TaxID=3342289 RepID=UPI003ECFCC30